MPSMSVKLVNHSSEMFPVPEPNLDLVDEAPNMDARLGWEWKPSGVKWLDPEVSSEVGEFPNETPLTDKQKIYALHRVKGCSSQFPFFSKRTALGVNLTDMQNLDPEMTVDDIIRNRDAQLTPSQYFFYICPSFFKESRLPPLARRQSSGRNLPELASN
ncbi:hypothetical protein FB451DRAFT_1190274 [Mycena latifolia]|nr:hypothetical protein FB451DRAFT_1190274 [Mycena latifolia]